MGMLEERKTEIAEKLKSKIAKTILNKKEVDEVCIVLVDTSSSMCGPVKSGERMSKLEAVQLAIPALRVNGANVMYGLVGFGSRAAVFQAPTFSFGLILSYGEMMVERGSTNMTDGLRCGLGLMVGKVADKKRMILLSDGMANVAVEELWDAVRECVSLEVIVDTIAFGDDADRETLRKIAKMTGGVFIDAPDSTSLKRAYERLNYMVRYLEFKEDQGFQGGVK